MQDKSTTTRAFKFLKVSVKQVQGSNVYLKEGSGETLQLSGRALSQRVKEGQEVVLVTSRSRRLYRVFNPETGDLFCEPATGRGWKIALTLFLGLTGGVPVLGPMIVGGILLWIVFIYLPKAITGEPYAGWQVVWGLGAIVVLYAALVLVDAAVLHIISAIVGLCTALFYCLSLGMLEKVVDDATMVFSRSVGLTRLNVIRRVPVFVSPIRSWKVVVK